MNARRSLVCLAMVTTILTMASSGATPIDPGSHDVFECKGYTWSDPPSDFKARDAENIYCSEQRWGDRLAHPVNPLTASARQDPYRDPTTPASKVNGVRFRYSTQQVPGLASRVEVYRPCPTDPSVCPDLPAGLKRFDAPYPGVITLHGLISRPAFQWWAAQSLAEAGYLVVNVDTGSGGPSVANGISALDWLTNADPAINPYAAEIDRDRIGISGHSQGGGVSFNVSRQDARISAIVDEDDYTARAVSPSDDYKPTLFVYADYPGFPGYPQPYTSAPDPEPVRGDNGFYAAVKAAGVDTMRLVVQGTTHVDWVGHGSIGGNRYAEVTTVYFMTAWFDRFLKGKLVLNGNETAEQEAAERAFRQAIVQDAHNRLTATTFDGSADLHNISMGLYDPQKAAASGDPLYGGNVPYTLAGTPIVDRLSFYRHSKCYLSVPGSSAWVLSENIRASGCA